MGLNILNNNYFTLYFYTFKIERTELLNSNIPKFYNNAKKINVLKKHLPKYLII